VARILVAEDSPDIRALVQMLLEAPGHDVVSASDGREAVSIAREARPDLILMDLSLPILSGWEATRQLRADPATSAIPIIAVTAHAMQGDRERALAAGCDGFIPKPINEETFASRVASYLGIRPEAPPESGERTALPGGGPGRILVVDDQADVARLVQEDLQADGHEVVVAFGAPEALDLFRNGRFDLCVIDVMLGGETGYSLTQTLSRQSSEFVPVLLVTAGTIDREKGFAVGADDFIGKPIDTVELRARARSLIRVGRLIREQRRLGRERSEAYRKLSELDRLRSDFLSTVSHELRTPLNTIVLLAHQIEKKAAADLGRDAANVRILLEAAEALRRMIDNMLDLAKLEAGQRDLHPQSVSVRELLRENADLVAPQAEAKGLRLEVEAHPDLPAVSHLDREKVSRVLVNLLSNAVKYTKTGRITLRAVPWQGSVTFEVSDTGFGIPADLIGAAFEPFRQIRPRTGDAPRGTGLGLTISKQLVEIMGGDLILESQEGDGTRVRFTLPDLPMAEEAPRAPEPAAPGERPRRATVLIVEDDQPSRYGLRELLESEGYDVREAGNLREAEAILKKSPPDVTVLDITLPDGDGAVWLRDRLDRNPRLPPVIALTGVTADADTRRIEAAGVRRVLTKPVNVARLLAALREILADGA
jgi:CheY-like chemotaxis protein